MEQTMINDDTIVAVSTAPGTGGIAVIRLSGRNAFEILSKCWRGKDPLEMVTHTAHLGKIVDSKGEALDQSVVTVFKAPRSFTGDDVAEISCHGWRWIQREIVNRLIECGARPAEPGEFTRRAFMNGKMDLAQAEGVADLIASNSRAAHALAIKQTDGRFTGYLETLRGQLVDFASLLELELDFSEEEVEFADRKQLCELADRTLRLMERLANSYRTGKALKEGVPVVIAGAPNSGKSTLLNALLDEDKAIVSDIPGTTRDIIEDTCEIDGILFRFVDTAGLRDTADRIERIGIDRAEARLERAHIVLWLVDASDNGSFESSLDDIRKRIAILPEASHLILLNKTDLPMEISDEDLRQPAEKGGADPTDRIGSLRISARKGIGMEELRRKLVDMASNDYNPESDIMLTNSRHYSAVTKGIASLRRAREALDTGLSADFIAQDVRETLHHLGSLTGAITTPDLLATIFSRFCIGK